MPQSLQVIYVHASTSTKLTVLYILYIRVAMYPGTMYCSCHNAGGAGVEDTRVATRGASRAAAIQTQGANSTIGVSHLLNADL